MVTEIPTPYPGTMNKVRVNQSAIKRLEAGHPWIFLSDVLDAGGAAAGEAVTVTGPRGQNAGTAHYSNSSEIALRMLSRQQVVTDAAFYMKRLATAKAFRDMVVSDTDAYRLVHAEGDLLPGLIVDHYAGHLVAQFLDQGMDAATPQIASALTEVVQARAIVARNDAAVRRLENLPLAKNVMAGELSGPVRVTMNGLAMDADLLEGQKTGVYLDQRENYVAAARYVKPGMRALDCFTSTGGFALHLARAGAHVEGIDSSTVALDTARRNAALNGLENRTQFHDGDVLRLVPSFVTSRRKYDIVIVDPPAFAKSRGAVGGALRGYRDINYRALQLLEPGGVLVTCSCSHHVAEAMLLEVVAEAALSAGKVLRVLERRGQAQDHPVLLTVPETLYLKCIVLQVLARSTDST